MSCRNTPAGSLATTYAKRFFHLSDSQSTNLFHELTREYTLFGSPTVTEESYTNILRDITGTIFDNRDIWQPGSSILERAMARITRTVNAGMPEAAIAYALINMGPRAIRAREATTFLLIETSSRTHFSLSEIAVEYKRLMDEYPRLTIPPTLLDSRIPGLPTNKATLYAVDKLKGWIRCDNCGRGRYLGVNDLTHGGCASDNDLTRNLVGASLHTISDPLDTIAEEETSPGGTKEDILKEENIPWDMESFQSSYNKAKAILRAKNDYLLPPNLELESIPGGITGGLGSRGTGNSFGVEIEVDFPSDIYPYNSRNELARRLYFEGITMYPQVAEWHHIGPNRDGGNFTFGSKDWICEFDRTVDDVEGERGVEIKSQIMFDEPETWKNLRRICEIITELGGKPTLKTGLHVNVGGSKFPSSDPAVHNALLRLAATYDDTIVRLAHNPLSANGHRGRRYCQPVQVPPEGFFSINEAKVYANHYQAFNLNHLPDEGARHNRSSRIEVRVWDSTLDPVRIQTAITLSLALVEGAVNKVKPNAPEELAGAHRSLYGSNRLSGEAWEKSTESFRNLVSFTSKLGSISEWHKDSLTTLFASSRWQSGQNYYINEYNEEDHDYLDD